MLGKSTFQRNWASSAYMTKGNKKPLNSSQFLLNALEVKLQKSCLPLYTLEAPLRSDTGSLYDLLFNSSESLGSSNSEGKYLLLVT